MSTQVENYWLAAALVLCTHACVLCARAGGVTLLGVIVNCTVYLCRWRDVTCRHLYYVLELVYYVPVQVEWRCYVRQPRTTVEWLLSVIRLTMTGACCLLVDWTVCLAHNICQLLYLSLMNLDLIFTIVVKQHAGNLTAVCVVSVFVYICSFHH